MSRIWGKLSFIVFTIVIFYLILRISFDKDNADLIFQLKTEPRESVIQIHKRLRKTWKENMKNASKWLKFLPDKSQVWYQPLFRVGREPLCYQNDGNMTLLIIVHSAPKNVLQRIRIRKTWGFYKIHAHIKILFFVGASGDETTENSIEKENVVFKDIIRYNFRDDAPYSTYKTIAMLEFVMKKCSNFKFLFKVDDDVFVNIPKTLDFTNLHSNALRQMFGAVFLNDSPIRYRIDGGKFVSMDEYSGSVYPPYLAGEFYLITTDLVKDLYYTAIQTPFLKIPDVFLSGLVRLRLGIDLLNNKEFYRPSPPLESPEKVDINLYIAYNFWQNPTTIYDAWKRQWSELWKF